MLQIINNLEDFNNVYSSTEPLIYEGSGFDLGRYGQVILIGKFGNDDFVAQSARSSYGKALEKYSRESNLKLLRRLFKDKHTSPLELCNITFHIKCPLFVFGHIVRHRTARLCVRSNRYSKVEFDRYPFFEVQPTCLKKQHMSNKQMSSEETVDDSVQLAQEINCFVDSALEFYNILIENGVSREIARTVLPQSTMTEFVWQMDLNNLFKFLKLRTAEDTQYQTRVIATAIEYIVRSQFPESYKLYKEFNKGN